ncbi:JAB domain-containing protein [Chryseobacterium sp.]|uniref:JAB domain-containing protein n=1 Tax=Chryseobacterium sp. TaxID=1871047 RepID=UPI002FCCA5E9
MSVELEIGIYRDEGISDQLNTHQFSSIDEAISYLDFVKLGYDSFGKSGSLLVRLENGSKPHLLDYGSKVPINEIRQELNKKYPNYKIKNNEIEKVTKEKETIFNSNFSFKEDEQTKYSKTTKGEELPFKLFRSEDSYSRSNLLWESPNSTENGDFALVERRFTESNLLQFSGLEKIKSLDDVAFLFKSLEDEAVEQAFLVYDFKDKGYFVQHISTGSFGSALIDNRAIIGNVLEANPNSITLVHNHPSGALKASKADVIVLEKLKDSLKNTDIKVNEGIIINLRSGKYLIFDDNLNEEKRNYINNNSQVPVQAYSFSKQVFVENFQPKKITTADDVAAFISSQKFGVSDKTEMLVMNTQLDIVGKFLLPSQRPENFIIEKVSKFGGTNCILYGNNITPELINEYNLHLKNVNINITDALLFKSENGKKIWESFMNEGLINQESNSQALVLNEDSKNELFRLSDWQKDHLLKEGYIRIPDPQNEDELMVSLSLMKNGEISGMWASGEEFTMKKEEQFPELKANQINQLNANNMEPKQDFNQIQFLKDQLKYLGFGENEKLHQDLESGIQSPEKSFEIQTHSNKTLPGNTVDFILNYTKSEKGGVFFNSYDAILNNQQHENISQNFRVSKENTFTAKEAVNLLEGRSVKIEFDNPKTNQQEQAFVKLNLNGEKNQYGNYNFQTFHQNYGVNTNQIVEKSKLIFDKPEYKESTIKSLEKGNVVKVKFEMNGNVTEAKAVLNPQYKTLNLYDADMNRINTNKPLQNTENTNKHEKSNVREQSISRGI